MVNAKHRPFKVNTECYIRQCACGGTFMILPYHPQWNNRHLYHLRHRCLAKQPILLPMTPVVIKGNHVGVNMTGGVMVCENGQPGLILDITHMQYRVISLGYLFFLQFDDVQKISHKRANELLREERYFVMPTGG